MQYLISQRGHVRHWLLALLSLFLISSSVGFALAEESRDVPLQQAYRDYLSQTAVANKAVPFHLSSEKKRGVFQARLMLVLEDISFPDVVDALRNPAHWCEFAPLHPNVKACTYEKVNTRDLVTMYLGTKEYQEPEQAKVLMYELAAIQSEHRFEVQLRADDGPYGTSDYRMRLEAIPVENGVFLRWQVSQRLGYAGFLAKAYLNTLARHKLGFTRVGTDRRGHPKYVRGMQAAIERNVVRYILALKVWFEAEQHPEEDRFERRLHRWFDETEQYKKQLYELEKSVYLDAKHRERLNQQRLQQTLVGH